MYRRFTVEEKIAAVNEYRRTGRLRETARRLGISHENIRRWSAQADSWKLYNIHDPGHGGKEAALDAERPQIDELPDDPEELKRIIFEQRFELDLMKAVVNVVKKDPGVDLATLTNREKTAVIDAMRPTYSLTFLASRLGIPLSTYHYNHAAIERGDGLDELRRRIRSICEEHRLAWGYRKVKLELENDPADPAVVSEKVVLKLMREMGLLASPKKRAGYSSYSAEADVSDLPNVPLREDGTHDFSAPAPNVLWVTDVTEFAPPDCDRVYLSPILDCFDGKLPAWKIALRATSEELTDPSLAAACETLGEGEHPCLHADRGGQYHAKSWIDICEAHGISRSMSRKGHSPDNARMEGFFGRLKLEFFYCRDWRGVQTQEFIDELDEWLRCYNETRPMVSLGWKSPAEYRRSLGYAA